MRNIFNTLSATWTTGGSPRIACPTIRVVQIMYAAVALDGKLINALREILNVKKK